jgi:hypothetical protein
MPRSPLGPSGPCGPMGPGSPFSPWIPGTATYSVLFASTLFVDLTASAYLVFGASIFFDMAIDYFFTLKIAPLIFINGGSFVFLSLILIII